MNLWTFPTCQVWTKSYSQIGRLAFNNHRNKCRIRNREKWQGGKIRSWEARNKRTWQNWSLGNSILGKWRFTVVYGDDVFARKQSGTRYRQLPLIVTGVEAQSQQELSRTVRLNEGPIDQSEVSKGDEAAGRSCRGKQACILITSEGCEGLYRGVTFSASPRKDHIGWSKEYGWGREEKEFI